jgi:amylo-alpha-1,6-glucosidase
MTDSSAPPEQGPAGVPTLLRSLTAAVLLDGGGDIELVRETRGAPVDWGGIYGQLVRLTGPWRVSFVVGESEFPLPGGRRGARVDGDAFRSDHTLGPLDVHQEIVPLTDRPGVVRTFRVSVAGSAPGAICVVSEFEPFLLPVLVEGIRPVAFRVETRPNELRVRQRGFALSYRSSVAPCHLFLDRSSWIGGRVERSVGTVASEHELEYVPTASTEIRFTISGGIERDLDRTPGLFSESLPDPAEESARAGARETAWLASTPTMRFPDAPGLERGYEFARLALRRLYADPGGDLVGLVAGYPWYSAIWCRDLAWMIPALLWLGDFDRAQRSLASVFRFQARSDLPLLGGEPGELPMQIAPGPIFLFGTSDTTLYYPDLVRRFVRHSGEPGFARAWGLALQRAVAWGRARSDGATGLVRNGGEAAAIAAATASLARVRYGIDAHDTTIWDSTDRRDHAIDVQVLWYEALRAVAELYPDNAARSGAAPLDGLADRVRDSIRRLYAWPSERFLYDSLREGQPVAKVRPNALRAVSAGLVDPEVGRAMVRRAADEDLSTPWGVRTLSSRDVAYDPQAYHDGQVWTIATGWAADAALAVGETELGVDYLNRIAARFIADGANANECYRGDRPEPFNSCFLLGLSVAPFLSTIFERLWGLAVDARRSRIEVHPQIPPTWRSASLENLRIGGGRLALDYSPGRLTAAWNGPSELEVVTPVATTRVASGGRESVSLQ